MQNGFGWRSDPHLAQSFSCSFPCLSRSPFPALVSWPAVSPLVPLSLPLPSSLLSSPALSPSETGGSLTVCPSPSSAAGRALKAWSPPYGVPGRWQNLSEVWLRAERSLAVSLRRCWGQASSSVLASFSTCWLRDGQCTHRPQAAGPSDRCTKTSEASCQSKPFPSKSWFSQVFCHSVGNNSIIYVSHMRIFGSEFCSSLLIH